MSEVSIQRAYLVGTHRYSFQAGEPAEILGMIFVNPDEKGWRLCYHIRFEDGRDDCVPVSEGTHYEIVSAQDIRGGRIPEVVH